MAVELTEDEICELAEIKNRLSQLVLSMEDKDISDRDILWMIFLELQGVIDILSYTNFDENDEVIPPESKKENINPDDYRS